MSRLGFSFSRQLVGGRLTGTVEIQGICDPAFEPVKEAFAENFQERRECAPGPT
jgi:hypothetical protein